MNAQVVGTVMRGEPVEPETWSAYLRVLESAGLCVGLTNNILAREWGKSRASVVEAAELKARQSAFKMWLKLREAATKEAQQSNGPTGELFMDLS